MALEPYRFEGPSRTGRSSVVLILVWACFLVFLSSLRFPWGMRFHGIAFLLLIGGSWWALIEGALYLLIVAFIFGAFSLTPSGLFWLALFLPYLFLRLATYRFTLSSRAEVAGVVFVVSVGFELLQGWLIHEASSEPVLSHSLLGQILLVGLIQAVLGGILAKPLLGLMEAR